MKVEARYEIKRSSVVDVDLAFSAGSKFDAFRTTRLARAWENMKSWDLPFPASLGVPPR